MGRGVIEAEGDAATFVTCPSSIEIYTPLPPDVAGLLTESLLVRDQGPFTCVEIGPRSDFDRASFTDAKQQNHYLVLGSPAVGSFQGPLRFFWDIIEGYFQGAAFGDSGLLTGVTAGTFLHIIAHRYPPGVQIHRRYPKAYTRQGITISAAAYAATLGFPAPRRKQVTAWVRNTGANNVDARLVGYVNQDLEYSVVLASSLAIAAATTVTLHLTEYSASAHTHFEYFGLELQRSGALNSTVDLVVQVSD